VTVPSVADLVEPEVLQERAGEYLQRAGEVLRTSGHVRIVEYGPLRVTADVDDGATHSVVLESSMERLLATCDCGTPSANGLCPHVVAAAIETWNRAPNRA
jgi:uncharacterized Zn finger protein